VGRAHVEPHREPEPSVIQWADADAGRDLAVGDVELALAGDQLERGVEAGGVADREQHLGVGRAAGAAQFLGHPQLEVEDAVVAPGVAVAAVAGGGGGGGVQDVHGEALLNRM
jgi:hypothetical protein